MRTLAAATASVTACLLLAGCGSGESKFALSQRTEELVPKARKVVERSLEANFGTPQQLVAWMKFPVEFGEIEGTIAEDSEADSHQISAKIELPDGAASQLERLGLIWTSGPYRAGAFHEKKDEQVDLHFQVIGASQSAEGGSVQLSLNAKLSVPVKAGDRFTLVGHRLQRGRKLYAQHCLHCHGVAGDGAGPTAEYLNPRPRDYRLGKFKFKSTGPLAARPSRADLTRILGRGIPGTYMPSFLLLEDDETKAIVEYIRWLAMRGEFENALANELAGRFTPDAYSKARKEGPDKYETAMTDWKEKYDSNPALKPNEFDYLPDAWLEDFVANKLAGFEDKTAGVIAGFWETAEKPNAAVAPQIPRPAATADSIARGRQIFLSGKGKCAECHGSTGEGNGSQTRDFQEKHPAFGGGTPPRPGLHDDWGRLIKPRDLTRGIYRGGRRPIDIYRRIAIGINGTPMPGFSTALTEKEIWDVVNYVMSIPYQKNGSPAAKEEKPAKVARAGEG